MIFNHLFWMAVVLFILSVINLNIYLEYRRPCRVLPYAIGIVGVIGMMAGFLRLILLSLAFNWWWLIGISGTSLLLIGILAHLSQVKYRLAIGAVNIVIIPFVWWYGSQFCSNVTFNWFYNIVDAIESFFV